jgi:hypothetical protein
VTSPSPQPPEEPTPRTPEYEPSWDESRRELNLSGPEFSPFFEDLEKLLCRDPVNQYVEALEQENLLMFPTLHVYRDVPPLWVYYRIKPGRILFVGLARAWADTAFVPSIWE